MNLTKHFVVGINEGFKKEHLNSVNMSFEEYCKWLDQQALVTNNDVLYMVNINGKCGFKTGLKVGVISTIAGVGVAAIGAGILRYCHRKSKNKSNK